MVQGWELGELLGVQELLGTLVAAQRAQELLGELGLLGPLVVDQRA